MSREYVTEGNGLRTKFLLLWIRWLGFNENFFVLKPLKGFEKINKLHLYNIFLTKKTRFGAMTDSVVMILQKISFL